jgi:hypothetical protein
VRARLRVLSSVDCFVAMQPVGSDRLVGSMPIHPGLSRVIDERHCGALVDTRELLLLLCQSEDSLPAFNTFFFLSRLGCGGMQVNLVLDDAVEFTVDPKDDYRVIRTELNSEILLNGNQIAVLVPGGTGPPDDSLAAAAAAS